MTDLTQDELLDVLIEECAEVIQAATKIKRFGWDRYHPGYGFNRTELAREIGDVMGVIDALDLQPGVMREVQDARASKLDKMRVAKRDFGRQQP